MIACEDTITAIDDSTMSIRMDGVETNVDCVMVGCIGLIVCLIRKWQATVSLLCRLSLPLLFAVVDAGWCCSFLAVTYLVVVFATKSLDHACPLWVRSSHKFSQIPPDPNFRGFDFSKSSTIVHGTKNASLVRAQ